MVARARQQQTEPSSEKVSGLARFRRPPADIGERIGMASSGCHLPYVMANKAERNRAWTLENAADSAFHEAL
jgi:hypothetical protein